MLDLPVGDTARLGAAPAELRQSTSGSPELGTGLQLSVCNIKKARAPSGNQRGYICAVAGWGVLK